MPLQSPATDQIRWPKRHRSPTLCPCVLGNYNHKQPDQHTIITKKKKKEKKNNSTTARPEPTAITPTDRRCQGAEPASASTSRGGNWPSPPRPCADPLAQSPTLYIQFWQAKITSLSPKPSTMLSVEMELGFQTRLQFDRLSGKEMEISFFVMWMSGNWDGEGNEGELVKW